MRLTRTVPALPVRDVGVAAIFYSERLGFTVGYADTGFALLVRDEAELHLWLAGDKDWAGRADLLGHPVRSGAESFLAGTASCRIEVDAADDVDALHAELAAAEVLHYADPGGPSDSDWGTREFSASDLDGNLLTFYSRRLPSVR